MMRSELTADLAAYPDHDMIVDIGGVLIDVVEVVHRPDRKYLVIQLESEDVQWVLEYVEHHGLAALRRRSAGSL